jgi:4-hydroxythreonine-4-phosphate dehydrogenase
MSPGPRPRLAISLGDPAGVGPEIICRACAETEVLDRCEPVVIGSRALLERVATALGLRCPQQVIDCAPFDAARVVPGTVAAANGALAAAAVERGIDGCLAGEFAALVTAPVHKEALAAAGVPFPGHTELLAHRCGVADAVMMLHDPSITVALVTCHQSLASVPAAITPARIERVGRLLAEQLARLHGRPARLAVCGLNPHAGEHGLFGDEEARLIVPAVTALRAAGLAVEGPLPPDTAFTAAARERFDGWVCMYHDQALIPFKALAFAEGVNVTLGLPMVRCSVDHGTAFDIAWQGRADHHNLLSAIRLALKLCVSEGKLEKGKRGER